MSELRFNSAGSDTAFLANANIFFAAVFALDTFKHRWREHELGSQTFLQKALDWYRQMFEWGLAGNRHKIVARKEARKALNSIIKNILQYLTIVAEESDIDILLSSGVVTKKFPARSR